jgi:hypothetical protein
VYPLILLSCTLVLLGSLLFMDKGGFIFFYFLHCKLYFGMTIVKPPVGEAGSGGLYQLLKYITRFLTSSFEVFGQL